MPAVKLTPKFDPKGRDEEEELWIGWTAAGHTYSARTNVSGARFIWYRLLEDRRVTEIDTWDKETRIVDRYRRPGAK